MFSLISRHPFKNLIDKLLTFYFTEDCLNNCIWNPHSQTKRICENYSFQHNIQISAVRGIHFAIWIWGHYGSFENLLSNALHHLHKIPLYFFSKLSIRLFCSKKIDAGSAIVIPCVHRPWKVCSLALGK